MNHLRRLRRLAVSTLAILSFAGVLAAPTASAATASVDYGNDQLVYTGSSESNNVTVSASGSTYVIADTGASITPGYGCNSAGAGKVTCTSSHINYVKVATNAGDDTVTVNGAVTTVLDGGAGNDRLAGGPTWDWISGGTGDDILDGRGGPDSLNGGDGIDTVDYSSRTAPVVVTPNSSYWTGDDGEANERDNVSTTVETIVGGSGNDTLTGSSAKNTLKGGPGDDKLVGAAGDDLLEGGPGHDTVDAGTGDDVLRARDAVADQLTCGDGTDTGDADTIDAVGGDCEGVALPSGGAGPAGNDQPETTLDFLPAHVRVNHRGRVRLRIACPEEFGVCEGTVVITPLGKAQASASKRKSKAIGRGRYKVKGGETKVIDVKLSRNGRRRVLRKKRLKCKASSVTRGTSGRKVTVRKKITLQAPRRKKS